MYAIAKWLNQKNIPTRCSLGPWRRSVIHQMLKNPAYMGSAAYRKTQSVPRIRNIQSPNRSKFPKVANSSRRRRDKSEWLTIQVPAIVEKEIFEQVQKQLEENKKFSGRNNKKYNYLSTGLLKCKECGYALHAQGNASHPKLRYYCCIGRKKQYHPVGKKLCLAKPVRVDIVDDIVWEQTKKLIQTPQLVFDEYTQRLGRTTDKNTLQESLIKKKHNEVRLKQMEKERILDLFQSGLITKEELIIRVESIRSKIKNIENEINFLEQEKKEQLEKLRLIERFEEFGKRIDVNLEKQTFHQKRDIVRLLVQEITVDRESHQIEIKHILPIKETPILRPDCTFSNIQNDA